MLSLSLSLTQDDEKLTANQNQRVAKSAVVYAFGTFVGFDIQHKLYLTKMLILKCNPFYIQPIKLC